MSEKRAEAAVLNDSRDKKLFSVRFVRYIMFL